ncbi:hypothetical protein [Mycobacterium aquaticum]|uniref:Uncharacterized protein n=1 Tax=Mycobacterium aquaticum TaxID=1927124 RepID=A0A1X0A4C8_9MYCO|nr:hypothetical protein [Mycobacterium aquaticum]ORA24917.1 hypothetical protein BST13_33650 [Mycobacterium aquaticum]
MKIRDLLHDLRHPITTLARELRSHDPEYHRLSRFLYIGWPDTTAKMLHECANILETGPNPHTEVARWLRSVADNGNGYLKQSAYTINDLRGSLRNLREDLRRERQWR